VQQISTLSARPTVPSMGAVDQTPTVGVRRLAPTDDQQGQRHVVNLRKRVSGDLQNAKTETDRRGVAAQAFEEGLNLPPSLMAPTLEEKAAEDEQRRKLSRNDWQWQQDYNENQIRTRPARPSVRGVVTAQDRADARRKCAA
jgi:hypothetical protein